MLDIKERIKELQQDIEKLEQIKVIYETTSDYLSASFYSDFMEEVNGQIEEVKKSY